MGHAWAQLPHDSQSVARQSGPNGASMSTCDPRMRDCRLWLRAAALQAPTQRWHSMHRLGSYDRKGLPSTVASSSAPSTAAGGSTPSSAQSRASSLAPSPVSRAAAASAAPLLERISSNASLR